MKKFFFLLSLLVAINVDAQKIRRNQWGVQPRVGISSGPLWGMAFAVEGSLLELAGVYDMDTNEYSEFWSKNSWFIPEIDWAFPIYSLTSEDGAKLSRAYWWKEIFLWGDYSHTFKISAGYELNWKSLTTPFGAFFGIDWEYLQIKLKECREEGFHRSQAIVPTAGIRYRLWGGSFEKQIKPAIELGCSYVYNFKYHNPNDYGLKAINNGFRGKVALGVEFPYSHTTFLLEYERDFFDHFNNDYESDMGIKPFEGYKNTFGELTLRLSYSF